MKQQARRAAIAAALTVGAAFAYSNAQAQQFPTKNINVLSTFQLGGVETVAELHAHDVSQPGERIDITVDMNRTVLIDPDTERVVAG